MASVDPVTCVKPSPNQVNSILEKSGTGGAGVYKSSGRECTKPKGLGVTADDTGVDVALGSGAGVAVDGTRVGVAVGPAMESKGVGVAKGAVSVGVDGFVGSGFGGAFVDEGSTSTLAATLASGVGISTT